jgi:hypothetical protein
MVQNTQAPPVDELLRRSQAARARLSVDIAQLKHRVDLPGRLKESLNRSPTSWIGGGLAAGLLASLTLRRPKAPAPKRRSGLTGLALTAAGALARPILKSWLTGKLRRTLDSRHGEHSPFDQP